jgi:PAS domain S-box-containing protein
VSDHHVEGAVGAPDRMAAARELLDSAVRSVAVERLTRLAARVMNSPYASASIVTDHTIIAGRHGFDSIPAADTGAPGDLTMCEVLINTGDTLAITDTAQRPGLHVVPAVRDGFVRSYLGVPLRTAAGESVGAICVFESQPRSWTDDDVSAMQDLAASMSAAIERDALAASLAAKQAQLDVALGAAHIGSFDWNLETGELQWDERLKEMFGYGPDFVPSFDSFEARAHPDDRGPALAAIRAAAEHGGSYAISYRVIRPDGSVRWLQSRGLAVAGPAVAGAAGKPVRVTGAAVDITDTRDGSDQIAQILETMTSAFFSLDHDWLMTYVNAEAERLLGLSRAELVGQSVWKLFPDAIGQLFDVEYRRAMETGQPAFFEEYFAPLSTWFEVRAWPGPDGLSVYFHDITQRRLAEEERETALAETRRANDRLRFVTDLSARLAGQMRRRDVLELIADAVVPQLADWCTSTVPRGGTELERVAAAHRDRALDALAKRLIGSYPHPYDGPSPGVTAYLARETVYRPRLVSGIIAELDDSDASAAYARTLTLMGDGPGLVVPVLVGGDVAAVMTLVRLGGRQFSDDDTSLITDVATRIANGLEAARYAEQQREVAGALQAVSLPERLPEKGRLRLAAGYRPASEGADVGGDWYDAFELPGGQLALAVGDAAGHGLRAAAIMGQLRNALRGYLFDGHGPAGSLRRLDSLLAALEPDAFATVVCITIDPTSGLGRWASAGHPAPVVVRANGAASVLVGEPAPPLGIATIDGVCEHNLTLTTGDRLLLYTDGLIERRGADIEVGLAHLQITAEQLRFEKDTGRACRTILDDMLAGEHDDDVCVLLADMGPAIA